MFDMMIATIDATTKNAVHKTDLMIDGVAEQSVTTCKRDRGNERGEMCMSLAD